MFWKQNLVHIPSLPLQYISIKTYINRLNLIIFRIYWFQIDNLLLSTLLFIYVYGHYGRLLRIINNNFRRLPWTFLSMFFKYLYLTGVWRNSRFISIFIFTSQHLAVFLLIRFRHIKLRRVRNKDSSFWAAHECTMSAQLITEEVLLLQHRSCHVYATTAEAAAGRRTRMGPCWEVGGWDVWEVGSEHKRGNTALPDHTQPLCSSALKKVLVPAGGASLPELHCFHWAARRSPLFHAEFRDNGGIRNRRGRAVVRSAGPRAG